MIRVVLYLITKCCPVIMRSRRRRRWICGKRTRFLGRFRFVPGRCDFVGRLMGLLGLGDEIRLGGDVPLAGGRAPRLMLVVVPGAYMVGNRPDIMFVSL